MKIKLNGTVTLEIPGDAELAIIYDAAKKHMDEERSLALMVEIANDLEELVKSGKANARLNNLDKMAWAVSEAYCMGFVKATAITYEALAETLKAEGAVAE